MSQALEESRNHWETRFKQACETMRNIRSEIHDLKMKQDFISPEFNVLTKAYEKTNRLIDEFHHNP